MRSYITSVSEEDWIGGQHAKFVARDHLRLKSAQYSVETDALDILQSI